MSCELELYVVSVTCRLRILNYIQGIVCFCDPICDCQRLGGVGCGFGISDDAYICSHR